MPPSYSDISSECPNRWTETVLQPCPLQSSPAGFREPAPWTASFSVRKLWVPQCHRVEFLLRACYQAPSLDWPQMAYAGWLAGWLAVLWGLREETALYNQGRFFWGWNSPIKMPPSVFFVSQEASWFPCASVSSSKVKAVASMFLLQRVAGCDELNVQEADYSASRLYVNASAY